MDKRMSWAWRRAQRTGRGGLPGAGRAEDGRALRAMQELPSLEMLAGAFGFRAGAGSSCGGARRPD